jgi:hypothetical protein
MVLGVVRVLRIPQSTQGLTEWRVIAQGCLWPSAKAAHESGELWSGQMQASPGTDVDGAAKMRGACPAACACACVRACVRVFACACPCVCACDAHARNDSMALARCVERVDSVVRAHVDEQVRPRRARGHRCIHKRATCGPPKHANTG